MRTKTDERRRRTVEEVRELLRRPHRLVIEDAVAYWLEDEQGRRLCPDSDSTIAPCAKVLELYRAGMDPDRMLLLTISVDDRLLKRARTRALAEGTTVDALLCEYLERYVERGDTNTALAAFAELAERSAASSGTVGRSWTRDDLQDRTTTG